MLLGLRGVKPAKGSLGVGAADDRAERLFRGESSSEGICWNRPEVEDHGSLVAEEGWTSDFERGNRGMEKGFGSACSAWLSRR